MTGYALHREIVETDGMHAAMEIFRFVSSHPLTRRRRLKALARVAAWQIKSRLRREVIVPWIANQKLAVTHGMVGATGNIYVGLHEFPDMMFMLHLLRKGDLFLDIGANVGTYSVLASGVCKATTWAFEPDPQAVLYLKRNIEINGLHELVAVHEFALGATERQVAFTIGLDTINRVATAGEQHSRMIRQKTLDSLIGDANPVFAKIDVENYEEDVIRGARDFLAKNSLQAIELETVTPKTHELLSKALFKRAFYDPFKRLLSFTPVDLQPFNALFIRDFKFVECRIKESPQVRVHGAVL